MNNAPKFSFGDEDPARPGWTFAQSDRRNGHPIWRSPTCQANQIARRDAQRAKKRSTPDGLAEHLCNNARARANRDHVPFELTAEWVAAAIRACNGKCPVLGIEFDLSGKDARRSISIDKVIPSLGYQTDDIPNVRICCMLVNSIKGKRTRGDDLRNAKSYRFSRAAQLLVADYIDRAVGEVMAALKGVAA